MFHHIMQRTNNAVLRTTFFEDAMWFFYVFNFFVFFIRKYMCLYILGHIFNVRNY